MTDRKKNLNSAMTRGAVWMVSMRWVLKVMGFVNVVILARLLVPEDFGLIATATIVIGLVSTVTDGSFDKFVLRNTDADDRTYNLAWTAQISAGLLATILIFLASPLMVAYAGGDQRLYSVLFIAGLRPAILGFENIGQVDFRRNFDFQKEFRYWIYKRSVGIALTLVLAFVLRDYRALAWAMPLTALSTVAISFVMSGYRPRFSLNGIGSILSFSKWFALLDTARYMADRMDEFVVVGIAPQSTVGHYNMASDVSTMPTRETILPLERALMPTLAHIGDDPAEFSEKLQLTLAATISFCLAAGIGLYAISDIFVRIVLGEQWLPSIPFFEWLAIYGLFSAIVISVQPFFVIADALRTYSLAYIVYFAILAVVLLAVGGQYGIDVIAPVRTLCMVALLGVMIAALYRMKLISLSFILIASWRPLAASLAMLFVLRQIQVWLPDISIVMLLFQLITGAATFAIVQTLCWLIAGRPPGVEEIVLRRTGMRWLVRVAP